MPSLHLRIRLESDLVISASSATIGGHRSLRRIPGRLLLGCCARQGYEGPSSFDLFHSGRVRYGDGFPEVDGSCALPMPMCFHREKGASRGDPLWNLASGDRPAGRQLEQEREGFVSQSGRRVDVGTAFTMRTAVGSGGRARDGFLFGMETISTGAAFRATIEADHADLLGEVERRLLDRSHRVGRSRTAEFGRVWVERAEQADWPVLDGNVDSLRIWCVSDLALRDPVTGAPRLTPTAADFGLTGARLDPGRTHLRVRRYSPFNSHRRRPEPERQVIVAGSVLVFEHDGIDLGALRARVARGVGEYTCDGLGQVLVQPRLLEPYRVTISEAEEASAEAEETTPPPGGDLWEWMEARLEEDQLRTRTWSLSRTWTQEMRPYRRVGTAQWASVRRIAAIARISGGGKARLLSELRNHLGLQDGGGGQASRGRRRGQGVTATRWSERRRKGSAGEYLLLLVDQGPAEDAVMATELLGARMVRVVRQRETMETGGTKVSREVS